MNGPHTDPDRWARLSDAATYAMTIHANQNRKETDIPYISHLLGVASLVLEHGGDEEQAIAGLLHDAIEDCGVEDTVLAEKFGPRVARIVRACTDADTIPKPPWRERKEAYIHHLETADQDTLLVSACDKLHNARTILTDLRTDKLAVFERFKGGQEGTLWYYRALALVFLRRLNVNSPARELYDTAETLTRATEALVTAKNAVDALKGVSLAEAEERLEKLIEAAAASDKSPPDELPQMEALFTHIWSIRGMVGGYPADAWENDAAPDPVSFKPMNRVARLRSGGIWR